ncbi:hypothetical protein DSECCO2_649280 [anaerobic digester metagenome]
MDAVVVRALDAGAWPVELSQAGDVEELGPAEELRDLLAHGAAGALGAVDDLLHGDPVGDAALVDLLGHQQGHGGRGAEDRGLEIEQELDLHVDVARPHGHGQGPDPLAAELESHARGPHAVAHGDLHAVQGRDAGRLVAAGEHGDPVVEVLLGVAQDLALARGAGAGVHAHELLEGHALQGKGVAVAQVLGGGEGQAAQVVQALDGVGGDAGGLELGAICGRTLVGVAHGPLESFELVGLEVLGGGEGGHEIGLHGSFLQSDIGQSGRAEAAGRGVVVAGRAEEGGAQGRVQKQVAALALFDDPAAGQQVGRVRGRQGAGGVLLDDEDGRAGAGQLVDDGENLVGYDGRQAQARLVQEQEAGPRHQRPAHGQHLLLSAGQSAGQLGAALPQFGEAGEDLVHAPLFLGLGQVQGDGPELEVLQDRQVGEDLAAFGRHGKPEADHARRRGAGHGLAVEEDLAARGFEQAHDALQKGALARAVGPDQGHGLPDRDGHVDAEEGLGRAIVGREVRDGQHQAVASIRPR